MGPRETKAWDEEAKIRSAPPGFGSALFALRLQKAILADALEEALNEWEEAMGDESAGTAVYFKRIEDLRAVLAEVDRG